MSQNRYLIVIEGGDGANYSAYSPDVQGVAATGATREECAREMQSALSFHLEDIVREGGELPPSLSTAAYAEI
ncbi:MAG: type II toxin-antitoxin system HicB family antitoxin [Thermoleophilaceae bacterium]|nr:type II toxin-antitoxin system HicB family antitoxin [Thermoleophilaceae bacterium]